MKICIITKVWEYGTALAASLKKHGIETELLVNSIEVAEHLRMLPSDVILIDAYWNGQTTSCKQTIFGLQAYNPITPFICIASAEMSKEDVKKLGAVGSLIRNDNAENVASYIKEIVSHKIALPACP